MKTSRVHTSFIASIILAELTCMYVYIHKHGWLVQMEVMSSYFQLWQRYYHKCTFKDQSKYQRHFINSNTGKLCLQHLDSWQWEKWPCILCHINIHTLHIDLRCLSWSSASVDVVSSSQLYHRAMLLSTSSSKLGTKRKATSLALMHVTEKDMEWHIHHACFLVAFLVVCNHTLINVPLISRW